jgi:hypothetical protein
LFHNSSDKDAKDSPNSNRQSVIMIISAENELKMIGIARQFDRNKRISA